MDVRESVYDWHVRTRQARSAGRWPNGRLGAAVVPTTLVVRPEVANDHVSLGYDTR
jgi:hypothetical protein